MTPATLSGAVLYVKDLAGLTDFYAHVLGVPVAIRQASHQVIHQASQQADHAVLQLGGTEFMLVQMPPHIAAGVSVQQPPERREDTPLKLCFLVPGMAPARERVAALGGQMNPPEREWVWHGRTVCDGHDPEGNVFQLGEAAA